MKPPPPSPDFLITAWPYLPLHLRLQIALRVFLTIHPFPTAASLFQRFSLHAFLTYLILQFLPTHPIAIPTALGLSFCVTIFFPKIRS